MKMTSFYWFVATIAAAAGSREAIAANGEPRTVEKHIVVSSESGRSTAGEPREPVTFLGVVVTPAQGALAAQLQLGEGEGLVVSFVEPDSPAAEAGLRQHDVLTKLDDQILIEPRQLSVLVRNHDAGDTVAIGYLRAGREEQVTVTLTQHEPAGPDVMQWFGKGTPNIIYRAESLGPSPDLDVHRIPRTPNGDFTIPPPPRFNVLPHPGMGGERVMIFRPQANVVFSDEAGTLVMNMNGDERVLMAKDAAGKVIFEGPIDTPEERAKLPDDLRQRLEKFEKLDVFDTPVPPVPPPVPGRPVAPRATGNSPPVRVGGGGAAI